MLSKKKLNKRKKDIEIIFVLKILRFFLAFIVGLNFNKDFKSFLTYFYVSKQQKCASFKIALFLI